MNPRILLGWALGATALALVFLGIIIGRMGTGPQTAPLSFAADPAVTTEAADANAVVEPAELHAVPPTLVEMPAEWRTAFDGELEGYAILFDLNRREVIVEQCAHPGYFDKRTGREVPQTWEFCESVLWGTLLEVGESSARVRDRRRGPTDLTLALDRNNNPPRLSLSFGEHDMVLIPGSKNDLFQAMDRSPSIEAQRNELIRKLDAREKATRRLAEEAAGTATQPDPVPVYRLPPADRHSDDNVDKP